MDRCDSDQRRSLPTASPRDRKEFECLAKTPAVDLGNYLCGLEHVGCGAEEATRSHVINFPRRGVYVKHIGGRALLVDASRAVFFNRGEPFRTSHPHGFGDGGRYLRVRDDVLRALVAEIDPREPCATERAEAPFRFTDAPLDAAIEARQAALFARPAELEALELEEAALGLAAAMLRRAHATRAESLPSPARDREEHRVEVADRARATLALRFRERLRLEDLAREVGVSMFHLCRVFKARSGTTLHEFRCRMRLGASLDRLASSHEDIAGLALELGFSSHSHFTRAFRRTFGTTPSEFRRRASSRRLARLESALRETPRSGSE